MTVTLSEEGRARLDRHLDAVEAALAGAGNLRERRRGVVDDLEAQIQEMLAARSATPTLEDVEAVLGKLDPPAAYRETAQRDIPPPTVASVPRRRHSTMGILSFAMFCTAGVGELTLIILALSGVMHDLVEGAAPLGLFLCIVGFVFGVVGCFRKTEQRWPAIFGTVLNGLVVLIVMFQLLRSSSPPPAGVPRGFAVPHGAKTVPAARSDGESQDLPRQPR